MIALVLAYTFNLDLKRLHEAPYYERDFKSLTAHTRTCEVELVHLSGCLIGFAHAQ